MKHLQITRNFITQLISILNLLISNIALKAFCKVQKDYFDKMRMNKIVFKRLSKNFLQFRIGWKMPHLKYKN